MTDRVRANLPVGNRLTRCRTVRAESGTILFSPVAVCEEFLLIGRFFICERTHMMVIFCRFFDYAACGAAPPLCFDSPPDGLFAGGLASLPKDARSGDTPRYLFSGRRMRCWHPAQLPVLPEKDCRQIPFLDVRTALPMPPLRSSAAPFAGRDGSNPVPGGLHADPGPRRRYPA